MEIPGQFIPGAGTSATSTDRTLFPESAGEPAPDQIGQVQQPFLALLASLVMEQGTGIPARLPDQSAVATQAGPSPIPVEPNGLVDSSNGTPVVNTPVDQRARMVQQMTSHQEGSVPVSDSLTSSFVRQAAVAVTPVRDPDLMVTSHNPVPIVARPFVMESGSGEMSKTIPHPAQATDGNPKQPARRGVQTLPNMEAPFGPKGESSIIPKGESHIVPKAESFSSVRAIMPAEMQSSERVIQPSGIPSTAGNETADISRSALTIPRAGAPAIRPPGFIQAIPVLRNPVTTRPASTEIPAEAARSTEVPKVNPPTVRAFADYTATGSNELPAISLRPDLPARESGNETTSAGSVAEPREVLLRVLDPLPATESIRTAGRQPAVEPPIAGKTDIQKRQPVVRTAPPTTAEKKVDVPQVSEVTLDVKVEGKSDVRGHAVGRPAPDQQSTDLIPPSERRVGPVSEHVNPQKVQTKAVPVLSRPVVDSSVAIRPGVTEVTVSEIGRKNVRPSKEPRRVEGKSIEKQDAHEGSIEQKAGPAGPVRKEQATSAGDEQRKESARPTASGEQPEKGMTETPLQVAKPDPGKPVARETEVISARKNPATTGPTAEKALPHVGGVQTPIRTAALHRAIRESSSGEVPARAATQVLDQLVKSIRMDVGERSSEMRIVLDPATLGEVLVNVSVENGSISAKFDVVNPETRAIIETNLPQLQQALAARGLIVDRIDVASAQSFMQRNPHESGQARGKQGTRRHNDGVEEAGDRSSRFLGYNTLELTL